MLYEVITDNAYCCGLACPIRAKQRKEISLSYFKVNALQGMQTIGVGFFQLGYA